MASKQNVEESAPTAPHCAAASDVANPGRGVVLFSDSDDRGNASVKGKAASGETVELGRQYMADAKTYGAKGDTVETVATVGAGESVATIADLTSLDVGKVISIEAAGDGADLITTITAVDGTSVTLADAATDGGTDAVTFIGTSDAVALAAADTAATDAGTLLVPPGKYLVDDDVTLAAGTVVVMRGASFVVLEGFTLDIGGYIQAAPDQLPGIADAAGLGTFTHTYTEGFYATAPIAKPEVATADAATILAALVALGLVTDAT